MNFTQLTDTLWCAQSAIFYTNNGIFASHGQALLIDPGVTPEEIRTTVSFLATRALKPQALILTHGHWDHILGPEHFPGVKVIAHTAYRDVRRDYGEALARQVAGFDRRTRREREQPFAPPAPHLTFDVELRITVGGETVHLLHAPGHAPDQLVIYHPASALLWAGDMLSDLEIPFVSHNLAAYEATLARLAALDVRVLVPGHGTPTTDPAEITARIAADRDYLAELHTRVSGAVAAGESLAEAVARCAEMRFRRPEENAGSHRLNVESVYLELGGPADPTKTGWGQEWEDA